MSLRGRRHGGGRKNELVFLTTCDPTTTFDPKITGPNGTWFFDDGTTLEAASGAEISKTFAAEGLHRAVYRPASGGLAAITSLQAGGDLITSIYPRFGRLTNLGNLNLNPSTGLILYLTDTPNIIAYDVYTVDIIGHLSQINRNATALYMATNGPNNLSGSLDHLPSTLENCRLYGRTLILAASIAHLTAIRDLRIYNMGWLTADVDMVIDSMWTARANYTWATPALQIGGTNQAPTGNVTAPIEGADWHQDGATWIPRTAGAKIYDLVNNVNSEVRPTWAITYTA